MRSIRYRKLMEAAQRITLGESLSFSIKVNENMQCECELQLWKEDIFKQIQKGSLARELLPQFKEWLEMPTQMMGKKSNEIALSKSRLYCIKNISCEDLSQFQKIFQEYVKFKETSQSLLVPIYGVACLHSNSQAKNKWTDSFIMMPNLGKNDSVIFDIKGFCDSRFVEERDFKDFRFGKDQNFIKSEYLPLIQSLPVDVKEALMKRIEVNIAFLRDMNVIDYSLLLVFQQDAIKEVQNNKLIKINEKYTMGVYIIDFLQVFNERKKLQNKFKSLFFKQISSVDPLLYSSRLLDFIKKILIFK